MATTSPPCAGILSRTCNTLLFLGLVWMSNGATSAEGSALSRGSTPGKDYPIATPSRFARIERSPARPRCRNAASDPSTWTVSAPVPDPAWPPKPMLYPRDPTPGTQPRRLIPSGAPGTPEGASNSPRVTPPRLHYLIWLGGDSAVATTPGVVPITPPQPPGEDYSPYMEPKVFFRTFIMVRKVMCIMMTSRADDAQLKTTIGAPAAVHAHVTPSAILRVLRAVVPRYNDPTKRRATSREPRHAASVNEPRATAVHVIEAHAACSTTSIAVCG